MTLDSWMIWTLLCPENIDIPKKDAKNLKKERDDDQILKIIFVDSRGRWFDTKTCQVYRAINIDKPTITGIFMELVEPTAISIAPDVCIYCNIKGGCSLGGNGCTC